MFNEESSIEEVHSWLFQSRSLTPRQITAISFAFISCLFSTTVCAPMGGSGAQSVFHTKNSAAYWLFFSLSPILILCLCGRATYFLGKELAKPRDKKWEAISNPPESQSVRVAKIMGWMIVGGWSAFINAYNTIQYVPGTFGWICFPFALCVPGIVNVPAIKEYHRRIEWLLLNCGLLKPSPITERDKLLDRLKASKRFYAQLSFAKRNEINAVFSHRFEKEKGVKLRLLFDLEGYLNGTTERLEPIHPMTIFFVVLGLGIGTASQVFAYHLGREIGGVLSIGKLKAIKPALQFIVGVGCAYVGIGMSAVACSDVFSEMSDTVHHWYKTGIRSTKPRDNLMRVGLAFLALAASACFVENQIKVMGQEGFGGKLLTICAIISPTCIGFWAGDRVLQDLRHRLIPCSYLDSHERLAAGLFGMQDQHVVEITRQLEP